MHGIEAVGMNEALDEAAVLAGLAEEERNVNGVRGADVMVAEAVKLSEVAAKLVGKPVDVLGMTLGERLLDISKECGAGCLSVCSCQ